MGKTKGTAATPDAGKKGKAKAPSPRELSPDLSDPMAVDSPSPTNPSLKSYDHDSLDLQYQPPPGLTRAQVSGEGSAFELEHLQSTDKELLLFRVPLEVSDADLKGLVLPLPNPKNTDPDRPLARVTTSSSSRKDAGNGDEYDVVDVTEGGGARGQIGEMAEVRCLVPSRHMKNYRIAPKKITRFYSIVPSDPIPTTEDIAKVGRKILNEPYVARVHPEKMKLQSEPFGFHTTGKPLEESLERYALHLQTPPPDTSAPATPSSTKKSKTKSGNNVSTPTPKKKKSADGIAATPATPASGKKRKGDGEGKEGGSAKKAKKVKAQAQ
ncbi:hypothetical protein HK104_008766 [Borealophlyctis nickersoniae]|nr:hypothetical protein HK104_008766 [Borealophlyctis nickersoniae]